MDPIAYLRVARRRWWVIALAGLLAVVAVTVTTPTGSTSVQPQGVSYTATHTLFLEGDGSGQPNPFNLRKAEFFLTVGDVPRRAAGDLVFDGPPAVLAAKISTAVDGELGALKITATDSDPVRVVAIADTFARDLIAYIEDTERARIQKAFVDAQTDIKNLTTQLAAMDAGSGPNPNAEQLQNREVVFEALQAVTERAISLAASSTVRSGFVTFEAAVAVPVASSGGGFSTPDSRGGRLVIVGLLGLLVGAGFALVIDRLDTSLHTKEAAEAAFGLPVLAEVPLRDEKRGPSGTELESAADPRSPLAQPYRMLRTALLLMRIRSEPTASPQATGAPSGRQVILSTSAGPEERQAVIVANLAVRFAESGRSVLIVSCDPLSYGSSRDGVPAEPGLADVVVAGGSWPRLADVAFQTPVPRVALIPPGRPGIGSSLALTYPLLAEARALADIVLIDAGPLLTSSEAGEVLGYVDSVVVVARAGRTTVDTAGRVGELLVRFGAPVAGVLLVGARYVHSSGARRAPRSPVTPVGPAYLPVSVFGAEPAPIEHVLGPTPTTGAIPGANGAPTAADGVSGPDDPPVVAPTARSRRRFRT